MSAHVFRLTPLDTLFFRDGRPFDMAETQSDAESLFPPPTRTLVGALRLALARGQGFSGVGQWGNELAKVLGDGPQDLGQLRFAGPYLALDSEALFPLPMHIVGARGDKTFEATTFLAPGNEITCDLGRVRLPMPKTANVALQSGAGLFLRRTAFEALMGGDLSAANEFVLPEQLFAFEPRTGLRRDPDKRTAVQGQLYRTQHVRLQDRASMVVEVDGLPPGWAKACPRLITLGGENRMADVEWSKALPTIKAPMDTIQKTRQLTITLLTPLRLEKATMGRAGETFADWEGVSVVSACLGKPIFMGGWDGRNKTTVPLCPYLPPGSTWFCSVDAQHVKTLSTRNGSCVGREAAFGFGAVALGLW
jgi:CRISPR-associated protein Cmr3